MAPKHTHPFYVFVWAADSETDFKNKNPLTLLGESVRRFGSTFGITVVILEGGSRLSESYKQSLKGLGFALIDYGEKFARILERFPNIVRSRSPYIRNCFLRWVALQEVTAALPDLEQCWHLDGDVLLYTSLDEIAADTKGKTFMLQGCPAFISIADKNWLTKVVAELASFERDIPGYCAKAFAEKESVKENDERLCNSAEYGPAMHDQDLLEYLVGSEKIPQTPANLIFNSKLFFTENPLSMKRWLSAQNIAPAETVRSDEVGALRLGGKKIAFLHYQGSFHRLANVYLVLVQCRIRNRNVLRKILANYKYSYIARFAWKFGRVAKERLMRALDKMGGMKDRRIADLLSILITS